MHCEIIDHYFNIFFVEMQLKKDTFKTVFWAQEFGCPNQYTALSDSLDMSLIPVTDSFNAIQVTAVST